MIPRVGLAQECIVVVPPVIYVLMTERVPASRGSRCHGRRLVADAKRQARGSRKRGGAARRNSHGKDGWSAMWARARLRRKGSGCGSEQKRLLRREGRGGKPAENEGKRFALQCRACKDVLCSKLVVKILMQLEIF
jgi:hypothetical protein